MVMGEESAAFPATRSEILAHYFFIVGVLRFVP